MNKGKEKCEILKCIRKEVAERYRLDYSPSECTHKGDCSGTCPKCDAELQELQRQLDARGIKDIDLSDVQPGMMQEIDDIEMLEGIEALPKFDRLMGDVAISYDCSFASTVAKALFSMTVDNFVFSPVGLCRVLEMLQEGMDENSTIYLRVSNLIAGFNSDIETIKEDHFKLEHASSVWYNKSLGFVKGDYLDTLKNKYDSETHDADFSQKKPTKLKIDKWVSDNTHQMIKALDTEISQDALLIVLDAIYMNGKWETPFDSSDTETDTFYNANGSETDVEMMYQNIEEAEYSESDRYQVIRLPYRNYAYSMVLVLPKDGTSIESVMETTDWLYDDSDICEVDLYMPRFRFDNTLLLNDVLKVLGLGDLFDKEDCFPRITDKPAHISQIKQQCVIQVEEEGTEAAALTIAECEVGCPPPDVMSQTVTMKLDKPFVFAVKSDYNQLLFMGVIKNMELLKPY